ncbi:DUF4188 domain-containing protein [Sciscionella sediminilitoris]|uniref:DUF4188 domain-containing protein n=1 Tax=Sciscionella sediminilitoris TaxID=1445613 RepID=UPI00055EFAC8|nr:DUF4188 domain-containing protein [Sciscionella sp. SE31]
MTIHEGRWTARVTEERQPVLFLIGMRVNHWWRLDLIIWVGLAMGRMLAYLRRHPEAGMLTVGNWFGRTTMQVGYWRSLDHVVRFAEDPAAPHLPAWRGYFAKAYRSGAIGVWHETHPIDGFDCVYVNMPRFGLGKAFEHTRVNSATTTARKRARRNRRPLTTG